MGTATDFVTTLVRVALETLIGGKRVRCVQVGSGTVCDHRSKPTNQGRVVAQCFVDGRDVAAILVEAGLACDWARFSGGHYSRAWNENLLTVGASRQVND